MAPSVSCSMNISSFTNQADAVTAPEWNYLLQQFRDSNVYQTWSYGAVRWTESRMSHLILRHQGRVAAMAQLRIIRFPLLRGGVAHLRWGPLCHLSGTEPTPEVFHQMATALHNEYVRKRRLFLRILPNAFVGSQTAAFLEAAFAQLPGLQGRPREEERTLLLDLAPPLETLRKRLDRKWRNRLNQAEKNGLEIREGNRAEEYRTFLNIYRQMWRRKRFEEGVDVDEFGRIQDTLPEAQRMKILICMQGETPLAGIVCSAMGNTGIYLLGATSDSGLKAKGAYLLQWTMIKWLKQHGFEYYDLGGIDPVANPGVYSFKRGLSGCDTSKILPVDLCESPLSLTSMKAIDAARARARRLSTLKNAFIRRFLEPKLEPTTAE